jgi:DNA-binding NarL/FixJ family response regulator
MPHAVRGKLGAPGQGSWSPWICLQERATDLDLPSAIKRVAAGELVFGEYTFEKLPPKAATTSGLSAREREALQLIVNGRSNRQIADQLRLSAHTVGVHRANIMKALRIHKTAELVAYANPQRSCDDPMSHG